MIARRVAPRLAAAALLFATCARAQDAPSIGAAPATIGPAIPAAPDEVTPQAAVLPQGTVPERHAAGVAAYEKGDFPLAEATFLSLVRDGHAEPSILLALGNAAYRRGRFVESVYAYEWGHLLAPTDEDIAANLTLARTHLVTDQLATGESAAAVKFREILRSIPTLWSAVLFAVLWTLGWLVLALRQRGRLEGLAWLGALALLLSLPPAAHVAFRVHDAHGALRGVLQTTQVEVRSGPGDGYATLFTLHAGTVLETSEERSGWRRVAIPHGPEGWVPSKDLAIFGKPETLKSAA